MLITTYAQNRPVPLVQEDWQSFNSTPYEDGDEDEEESRRRQSEESEVEVRAFGKSKFANMGKESMIASELRATETVDSDFMRTTNVFKTQRI